MDSFVFRNLADTDAGAMRIPDIAGESLHGMHVDPVIPGTGGFEDPLLGFEDPLFGLVTPMGFEDPLFG
ncbi:hypothetical protein I5535_09005 [Rhodobacteraceae bacterium F11138]|nr:hypothetical protein [Rhodobacteraceae bacterium F11138]